jgi:hypothetical protein
MNRLLKYCLLCPVALSLMAQPGPPPPRGEDPHGFGAGSRFAMMGFGIGLGETVTGAPYSAVQTTETVQKLTDGNTIQRSDQANVYRDTLGRVRVEHSFTPRGANATPVRMISIFDPVAGYSYMLDLSSKTAVKSAVMNAPGIPHHGPPPSRNTSTQTDNLGVQTVNGVLAAGTRSTQTIPAGAIGNAQPIQVVREAWISQDLKVPVMIKASDPRFGETVMQLTNIVRSDPDPSLFQVPAGFSVVNGRGGPGRMLPPAH